MENKILKLSEIKDKIPIPKDFNNLRNLTEICKFIKNIDNSNLKQDNLSYRAWTDLEKYIYNIISTYFIKTTNEWKKILSEKDINILTQTESFKLFNEYDVNKEWIRFYEFPYNKLYYIRVQNENKFYCLYNTFSRGMRFYPDRCIIKDNFVIFLTHNIFKKNGLQNQANKFIIDLLDYSVKIEQKIFTVNDMDECYLDFKDEFFKDFLHLKSREIIQTF